MKISTVSWLRPTSQGSRAFVEVDPDYRSTREPWNTSLYITDPEGQSPSLKAVFLDHGNTFIASWINDELIFVQVWWGRFGSSDLIHDTTSGHWIYNKFAHYLMPDEFCQDASVSAVPK